MILEVTKEIFQDHVKTATLFDPDLKTDGTSVSASQLSASTCPGQGDILVCEIDQPTRHLLEKKYLPALFDNFADSIRLDRIPVFLGNFQEIRTRIRRGEKPGLASVQN